MEKHFIAALAATVALGFSAPAVQADGHLTLAQILLADGDQFDTNQDDFDIVTEAILATGLGGAADTMELTAFLPTDKAFRILVEDAYGLSIKDEAALFQAIVDTLGGDTVRDVLYYHLVAGTVMSGDVVAAGDGAEISRLLGNSFTLDFKGKKIAQIRLTDNEPFLRDPIVRAVDITAENGVAHVIDRVLPPVALLD